MELACFNSLATIAFHQDSILESDKLINIIKNRLPSIKLISKDSSIAFIYSNLGYFEKLNGNLLKSEYYFNKANDILKNLNSPEIISVLCNLSRIRSSNLDLQQASNYLNFALYKCESIFGKNNYRSVSILLENAKIESKKENYEASWLLLNKSQRILLNQNDFLPVQDLYFRILLEKIKISNQLKISKKDSNLLKNHLNELTPFLNETQQYILNLQYFLINKNDIECLYIKNHVHNLYSLAPPSNFILKPTFELDIELAKLYAECYEDLGKALRHLDSLGQSLHVDNNLYLKERLQVLQTKINLIDSFGDQINQKNLLEEKSNTIFQINELLQSSRSQNSVGSLKHYWAKENLKFYEKAIIHFLSIGDMNNAFSFAEENKSNLLVKSINNLNAKSYANIPSEWSEKEIELKGKISFLKKHLYDLKNDSLSNPISISEYENIILENELKLSSLLDSIELLNPDYYNMKYDIETLNIHDIKSSIDSKTAFIEYFIGEDQAYCFTITSDTTYVRNISEINYINLVQKYYTSITNKYSDKITLDSLSLQLRNLLLDPNLELNHPNIDNLLIVPDDNLSNIPFEYFLNEIDSQNNQNYIVQYQYSGRLWKMLKQKIITEKTLDLVGYAYNSDNLEYLADRSCHNLSTGNLLCSEKEIQNICHTLGVENTYINLSNSIDLFKKAQSAKILHLATHACLDHENPEYSRIYFHDGEVTNIDLQLKNINAELAVLSACESGLGELLKGEGAMSISKGFFHAGCKSTLVSLWPVDDCSTAEFMTLFYTFLKAGDPKDVALFKTKQKYQETAHPSRTHPYYWAGFILIGDNSPVFEASFYGKSWIWILFSFITIMAFVLAWNKRRPTS